MLCITSICHHILWLQISGAISHTERLSVVPIAQAGNLNYPMQSSHPACQLGNNHQSSIWPNCGLTYRAYRAAIVQLHPVLRVASWSNGKFVRVTKSALEQQPKQPQISSLASLDGPTLASLFSPLCLRTLVPRTLSRNPSGFTRNTSLSVLSRLAFFVWPEFYCIDQLDWLKSHNNNNSNSNYNY